MIGKMNLKKCVVLIVFLYVAIFSVNIRLLAGSDYLSYMSLSELIEFTFSATTSASLIYSLLVMSYPLWMGVLFVIYDKKNTNKRISYLIDNISYIVPTIIITQVVVALFLTYISPYTPSLSNFINGSWILFGDITVSLMVSILWIGILLIIRLFFSTDWIVVLLSVVLFYFHALTDMTYIIPSIKKIWNNSSIASDPILFNHFGINNVISNGGGYYLFGRLLIMIAIYYSLYYLLKKWRFHKELD